MTKSSTGSKNFVKTTLVLSFLGLGISACTKKVTRLSADSVVDISGRWNDTDARKVASMIASSILSSGWLEEFQASRASASEPQKIINRKNTKPIIVVGDIKNKSSEHIESDTFIKDIERELINSGSIRIITNSALREKIRSERRSQVGYSPEDERKKFGKELGADFIMFGTINTIVDANEDDSLIFYQISMELVDLETGEVVWTDNEKIKKYKSKSRKVRSYQKNDIC